MAGRTHRCRELIEAEAMGLGFAAIFGAGWTEAKCGTA
jgi:hypothetical protein